MDWDKITDNWPQFVGMIRGRWGKLTEDDIAECRGNRDRLVEKLQQLYGMKAEQADRAIAQVEHNFQEGLRHTEKMYAGMRH